MIATTAHGLQLAFHSRSSWISDKRKAYTVAGSFWSDTVQPFITDPANKTIFERASVTKRAQWLGQLLHELGWRNSGEVDFVRKGFPASCCCSEGQSHQVIQYFFPTSDAQKYLAEGKK
jgi:hypothetical protein